MQCLRDARVAKYLPTDGVNISHCVQIMQGSDFSNEVVETDVFLSNATVVEQPSDGSCLYHASSFCLANSEIYLESYISDVVGHVRYGKARREGEGSGW